MDLQALLGQLLSKNSMGSNVLGELLGGGGAGGQGGGGALDVLGSLLGGKEGGGLGALAGMLGGAGGASALTELLGGAKQDAAAPASEPAPVDTDSEAEILIRAMCNAAKSDGSFDKNEQENILGKLGEIEQEELNFIRNELAQPLDVQAFASSVPRGLEQKAYAFSVLAIKLDEQSEAQYLAQLAQGLRLDPATCNKIHEQFGAPQIFR